MKTPVSSPRELPTEFSLSGRSFTLRSLGSADADPMVAFARGLPPNDLLFLRQDITQPAEVGNWIRETEEGTVITIVALEGAAIVGYATLDRGRAQWMRHVGEIRLVVGEAARGLGIGKLLLELAFETALGAGVLKVVARMTPDQTRAVELFHRLGFEAEATLHEHAIGINGCMHDLLVYSYFARRHRDNRCTTCGAQVLGGLELDRGRLCATCYHMEYLELGGGD